ncbi:MAG: Fe-S protein assembly co-chaperone HscB [Bryobacterales bacterium]|nr:Fe-S protein assembly co-chaperone HscB [Bryobacterales bacterium]
MEHPSQPDGGGVQSARCRQCGESSGGELFCAHCGSLQRPATDYYVFFGLKRVLVLDTEDLQRKFYELSRRLHPDRFTWKSAIERQYSLEATAILNDGYRVLRDPLMRAEYVLKQEGFDIGEQRSKDVPPELLEEVFDLNMALEELRLGDEEAHGQIEEARNRFLAMRESIDKELETLYRRFDDTQDRGVLQQVRTVLNRRRYVRNLVNEVEKELAREGQPAQ